MRAASAAILQECWTIRQGTPMEAHLMPFLVEDRQATTGSMAYLGGCLPTATCVCLWMCVHAPRLLYSPSSSSPA